MNGLDRIAYDGNTGPAAIKACSSARLQETAKTDAGARQDRFVSAREYAAQLDALLNVQDKHDIPPDWENSVDWGQMVRETLASLERLYGRVTVTVASLSGEDLREYAASLGTGAHLVVSEDFLEKMAGGAKAFFKGKAVLEGLARQLGSCPAEMGTGAYLDGEGVTFWAARPKEKKFAFPREQEPKTLFEQMEELRKKAEENKEKFRIRVDSSIYQSPADALGKLARAQTPESVHMVISSVQRKIYTLKLALSFASDKEKSKMRAALAALEKVVARAGGKIKELNEEADIRRRQKKAEKQRQDSKAEQIKYELKKKQAFRHAREHGQIVEGMPWFYYQQELMRQKQIPEPEEMAGYLPEGAALDPGISAPSGEMPGGSIAAGEVVVSPTVEISIE